MTRRDLIRSSQRYFVCENEISFSTTSRFLRDFVSHFNREISLIRKQYFFELSKTITRSRQIYIEISRDLTISRKVSFFHYSDFLSDDLFCSVPYFSILLSFLHICSNFLSSILFRSVLFYSILFYSVLVCYPFVFSVLLRFVHFFAVLFCSVLFKSNPF